MAKPISGAFFCVIPRSLLINPVGTEISTRLHAPFRYAPSSEYPWIEVQRMLESMAEEYATILLPI